MRLSAHFTLAEFETSQTAARRGIDNRVPERLMPNLQRLVGALEQVRQIAGGNSLRISSGYRAPQVNALVGGSATSDHMDARAADFTIPSFGTPLELCLLIAGSEIQYDQLIHEFGAWVHMSVPGQGQRARRRNLTIDRQGARTGLLEVRP